MEEKMKKILNLKLNPWWKDGNKVAFEGERDQKQGYLPQDVQFIIKESQHGIYTRKGDYLIWNTNISLKQALTGFVIYKQGVDVTTVRLEVNDAIRPNEEKHVRNAGMKTKNGGIGDVIFNIEFLSYLNYEQKDQAKRFLPD